MTEHTHYYVDQEQVEEMTRLLQQSRFLITSFGGVLEDRPDFANIEQVLDLACGPGEWASQVARDFPHVQVTGLDISHRMIAFAQAKAHRDQFTNVTFIQGDATYFPLPYADASVDLIHISLIYAFMTRELWPRLIAECYRILRPGGYLRVIQEDAHLLSNSPALSEFHRLGALALYKAGQGYYPDSIGLIPRLANLFEAAGFHVLSQRHYHPEVTYGTEGYQVCYEDYKVLLAALRSFLVKWQVATEVEAETCYQSCLQEMRYGITNAETGMVEKFSGFWHFFSIFGIKPV